jgi:transcriptional regulator with XRE-family HTH domain
MFCITTGIYYILKTFIKDIGLKKKLPRNYLVGEFLQKKRQESGLSQGDLAAKLGYSTSQFVSNWERGLCSAPFSIMSKLVKLLRIDRDELLNLMMEDSRRGFEEKLKMNRA